MPESIENPLLYYRENIGKSLAFFGHLFGHGCTGITVLELVSAVEAATGQKVDVRTAPRRVGDTAGVFTQRHRSQCLLGWQPVFSLEDSIRHALQWHALRLLSTVR